MQQPDPRPGNYYVSMVDGPRFALLAGPFAQHAVALDQVEPAKTIAQKLDPWADFYAFGTVRMADDYTTPGKLNERLGLDLNSNGVN
jgi:hypothetical protein